MRRRWKTLLPLAAVLAVCGALPTLAAAQSVAPFSFETSFNGAESTTGPVGGEMRGVMVNDETNRVLVLTSSAGSLVIDQFNAAGEPVSFSAPELHGSSSLVLPSQIGNFIEGGPTFTVDNSGTATQGRIYVNVGVAVGRENGVLAYNPDGSPVGGNFPLEVYTPSGAGVDPSTGELLVNEDRVVIERFTPEGVRTKNKFRFGGESFWGTQLAVDTEGNVYLSSRQGITKYSKTGALLYILESNRYGTIQFNTSISIDPATDNVFVSSEKEGSGRVTEFNKRGTKLASFAGPGIGNPAGIAFDPVNGKLYVGDNAAQRIDIFSPGAAVTLPEATGGSAEDYEPTSVTLDGSVEPDGVPTTECAFEWGPEVQESYGPEKFYEATTIPCSQGQVLTGSGEQRVTAELPGLTQGDPYHYRLVVRNANGVVYSVDHAFSSSAKPAVSATYVTDVHSDTVELHASVNPGGAATAYHFEYGTVPCSSGGCTVLPTGSAGNGLTAVPEAEVIRGLAAGTTYHYRLVAENQSGLVPGLERTFTTFPPVVIPTGCPNEHVRQQTGAALLLDCRAYELVSAVNTGGYDVESSLVPGQTPFEGYPEAFGPSRVLYGTDGGGIPNVGSPTNHGVDPYVATRTENGWVTAYVGIPADDPTAAAGGPFGSTLLESDSRLGTLAFGGPEICAPCFPDGSSGIPVHLADGTLVQGMAGSIPQPGAAPAGHVGQSLSADGDHLVFGSTSRFEPAGNSNGDVTIYERDLGAASTQVVSTLPSGATMTGAGTGELGVSADGARVVVGGQVGADTAGNPYWHLYEHVGNSAQSVDLTPGTTTGVLFDGMSEDGSKVFFTTKDKLLPGDTDASADIYEATVGGAGQPVALRLVSAGNGEGCEAVEEWNVVGGGNSCGAVAIGGGGGVSADGNTIYFLSPELLAGAGEGVADQPNLYVSRNGAAPRFVATVDDNEGKPIDDPTVTDSVAEPETHRYGNFQVTGDGRYAAFPSALSLTAYLSEGHTEVYRFDAEAAPGGAVACPSCAPTNAKAGGDASLPPGGLGLIADGRVFFDTTDALAPRDLDGVLDAYEWEAGNVQLISTGTSQTPSAFLGVSSDGIDAYFFTRDQLVPQDINGNHVKIYDARVEGGFAFTPEPVPCKASDECHGPSSEAAPSPPINTLGGEGGNLAPKEAAKKCAKGKVHKKGKCVRKHQAKKKKGKHKKSAGKGAKTKGKTDRKQGGRSHG
jgi:DNA-binding beta-propeller fold protein YncE